MKELINDVRNSIKCKNWYAALALAMALPDICSKLEYPSETNTGVRYSRWFDEYLLDNYTAYIGPNMKKHIFLTGYDFYYLRCAFLHQGEDTLENNKKRVYVEKFQFTVPMNNNCIHLNGNKVLQLQVNVFCEEICTGAEKWYYKFNKLYENKSKDFLKITFLG